MPSLPDSPLSITASIAGILTFVVALLAATYVRLTYLRNADSEYFQVKASLSWYKTESTWMKDLLSSSQPGLSNENELANGKGIEKEMYIFVMDQLVKLEERLLELVTETEMKASRGKDNEEEEGGWYTKGGWAIVPTRFRGRTDIAMSWLPVRAKAMELVRQRDALGSRVLFAQMSMISSRVRDQESRSRKREENQRERLDRLEDMVHSQHEKLDRLEGLVYRIVHKSQATVDSNPESPQYENYPARPQDDQRPVSRSQTEIANSTPRSAELGGESRSLESKRKPSLSTRYYPIPSI